jgi:hypothetical protein
MLIIGLGSKARQGKDSAAQAIKDHYDQFNDAVIRHDLGKLIRVGIFKFATALYQEVNDWLSVTKEFLPLPAKYVVVENGDVINIPDWVQPDSNPEVSDLAPYGKHPKLLQWWGTNYRRAQDPDYWTKKLFANIPSYLDIALVTDVRFPNEANGIKERGGYNVQIQRLNQDGGKYFASDRPLDHPSETALDSYAFDFHLVNVAGHAALLGEQAVTLTEYLRGVHK